MTLPEPEGPSRFLCRHYALLSQSLPSAQSRLSLYLYTLSFTSGVTLSIAASPRCQVTASMKPAVSGPRSLFCLLWDLNSVPLPGQGPLLPTGGSGTCVLILHVRSDV